MYAYLINTFVTLFFSVVVIFYYYFVFSFHVESFSGAGYSYFVMVGGAYLIYKIISTQIFEKREISFNIYHIISLFLVHLLIVSICYFIFTGASSSYGVSLFFKVLWFSLLPVCLFVLHLGFGRKVLHIVIGGRVENDTFHNIIAFTLGFFLFCTGLSILLFLGAYTFVSFLLFFGVVCIFSFSELRKIFHYIGEWEFRYDNHDFGSKHFIDKFQPYLLLTEFLFIVATFLISVNLINVLRPYPIGWDDLGVYMNIPKQIAALGTYISIGQMYPWQVFTGIGFLFSSTTQAFFLNSFAGIISATFIGYFIRSFVRKSSIIPIPLTIATIYLSLPMVIFHLAKDMKLDQGLFFVTIATVFLVFSLFINKQEHKKEDYIYMLIAGILAGFCFSIKLTSLLLISSLIGVITYSFLGIFGFIGYIGVYFAVFTVFDLWTLMNVVYPKEGNFVTIFSVVSFVLGGMSLWYSFMVHKKGKKYVSMVGLFIIGIIVAIFPWVMNNIAHIESNSDIHLLSIINGKAHTYRPDYTLIRSQEFIDGVDKFQRITQKGTAINEDLGRYFGYETGVNNYLKLPWNLTMQVNQKGEFTEISFIFLALFPALMLFFPVKNWIYRMPIYLFLLLIFFIHIFTPTGELITLFLSQFVLPFGYVVVLGVFAIGLIYMLYGSHVEHQDRKFYHLVSIFGVLYIFLWSISSYGIVWYGMGMYVALFSILALGLYYLGYAYKHENNTERGFQVFSSICIFFVIASYFFHSSFPHGFNNIQVAGFSDYKIGRISEGEAIFRYHPEYLSVMFELNIKDEKKKELFGLIQGKIIQTLESKNVNPEMIEAIRVFDTIEDIHGVGRELISAPQIQDAQLKSDIRKTLGELYNFVVYPPEEYKNKEFVYRVGTFMKYFISENTYRLFDDSLLFEFDRYFYPDSSKETIDQAIENVKKTGMKYILIDLNAATIDDDPAKNLTRRYEKLLRTLTSDQVSMISNDSLCFQTGLEDYKKSQKTDDDMNKYVMMAGVNHESMGENGVIIGRGEKATECVKRIFDLLAQDKVNQKDYSYLLPILQKIQEQQPKSVDEFAELLKKYTNLTSTAGQKALFKIN